MTNAAVLLFAKNIQQFYPNCRIRFVRYDGSFAKVGTEINITRDYILTYMMNKGPAKRMELVRYTKKSTGTVSNRLNHLMDIGLVGAHGLKNDPNRTYMILTQISG